LAVLPKAHQAAAIETVERLESLAAPTGVSTQSNINAVLSHLWPGGIASHPGANAPQSPAAVVHLRQTPNSTPIGGSAYTTAANAEPVMAELADAPVATPATVVPDVRRVDPVQVAPPVPHAWEAEIHYAALMEAPQVREWIDREARQSRAPISGEQILKVYDSVMQLGVPMEKVAAFINPLYASWGVKTGKQRVQVVPAGPGRTILRLLCSLARRGQKLRAVRQADDACGFEAALPSDLFSFEGDLLVYVRRHGPHSTVEAATNIPGTFFDWGKSNRCLERLYADLASDPA
jgi:hypothetical protein